MPYLFIQIPEAVREKLEQRGITEAEVASIVYDALTTDEVKSRSTGRPMFFGQLADGSLATVVFEYLDDVTIEVVTAYAVD